MGAAANALLNAGELDRRVVGALRRTRNEGWAIYSPPADDRSGGKWFLKATRRPALKTLLAARGWSAT